MKTFIVITVVVAVFALAVAFLVALLKFRNTAVNYQERIMQAKSRIQVEKNTMSTTMRASTASHQSVTADHSNAMGRGTGYLGGMGTGFMSGNMAKASMYSTGANMVGSLAQSKEDAIYALNELVSAYNRYISQFPHLILAAILKYKKEQYFDQANLDKSIVS